MARPESQRVAGYFPTPDRILSSVGGLVSPERSRKLVLVDPCAGEGGALQGIASRLREISPSINLGLYGCEVEVGRAAAARDLFRAAGVRGDVLHCDLFMLRAEGRADVLWLNPPYDRDPEHGRLEERFLVRALPLLASGGLLLFLVPGPALAASAATLALWFWEDLQAWRLPDPEYSAFGQVLVAGTTRRSEGDTPAPLPEIESRVRGWAAHPADLPVLPDTWDGERRPVLTCWARGFSQWEPGDVDLVAAGALDPWTDLRGTLRGFRPPDDLAASFRRTYQLATPPRAAHLSAALAAGVFNGAEVVPRDGSTLPPLLVKGVFEREWRKQEDRFDKKGKKVAEVQVQHPRLRVSALDFTTGEFLEIGHSPIASGAMSAEGLTLGDLVDAYGPSLMARMLEACPVLHDVRRGDPLPEMPGVARTLFPAQHAAVGAICAVLSGGDGALLLGEVGCGKTTVALAAAGARGARRILVVCPPHLVETWRREIAEIIPSARALELASVSDCNAFAASLDESPVVALLSRERAKLGHRVDGAVGACPRCGDTPSGDGEDLRKIHGEKRARCESSRLVARNPWATWLATHARNLSRYLPGDPHLGQLLPRTRVSRAAQNQGGAEDLPRDLEGLRELLTLECCDAEVAALGAWVCPDLAPEASAITKGAEGHTVGQGLRQVPLFARASLDGYVRWDSSASWDHPDWRAFDAYHAKIWDREMTPEELTLGHRSHYDWREVQPSPSGTPTYRGAAPASTGMLRLLITAIWSRAKWRRESCGEPLFQAVPEPRRYPLASYLTRGKRCWDLLVLDEAHEYSGDGAAQAHAGERLALRGGDVILMTGSLTNGYAESAYAPIRATSRAHRQTFGRDGRSAWIDRYGYWKQVVEEKDGKGEVIEWGSVSDRVRKTARRSGVAPGLMPLVHLDWILPRCVTLQKDDLRVGIPSASEERVTVFPGREIGRAHDKLLEDLKKAIREHRRTPGAAGALWGALSRAAHHPDLCAAGPFEVVWPDSAEGLAGKTAAYAPAFSGTRTPKEEWLVKRVLAELAEGRATIIFAWHQVLLPRYARILAEEGLDPALLLSDEVPARKRVAWIDKEVLRKGRRVLVVNPASVETGLNNLVSFSSAIWMENPACDPTAYRQAFGRIDRVGQKLPTRSIFPVYADTLQEAAHRLLLHKVGVSRGADGLDPEEALRAAGALGEGDERGLAVGRELYRMISGEP